MAIGLSIFLIAIGAIFRFGISVNLSSLDFHAIGLIIMLAGSALLLVQMYLIIHMTAKREPRRVTDRRADEDITSGYRDSTRDDSRPPYYLGPPLTARR
jgi:hypothetical protein